MQSAPRVLCEFTKHLRLCCMVIGESVYDDDADAKQQVVGCTICIRTHIFAVVYQSRVLYRLLYMQLVQQKHYLMFVLLTHLELMFACAYVHKYIWQQMQIIVAPLYLYYTYSLYSILRECAGTFLYALTLWQAYTYTAPGSTTVIFNSINNYF